MRFAMHKEGETSISLVIEIPEQFIEEVTPPGSVAVPVALEVTDTTHIIVDGVAVLRPTAE